MIMTTLMTIKPLIFRL